MNVVETYLQTTSHLEYTLTLLRYVVGT